MRKLWSAAGRLIMALTTSDNAGAEPYALAASANHLLHRVEQLAADRFARLVGDTVTLRQFAVLAAVSECSNPSQSDLVRITGIDRSTLADMMNRMEKRGWVTRTASVSDARALAVRLTPAGSQIFQHATPHARAADAAILDALPRTKRKSFLTVLVKLAKLSEELAAKSERDARRQTKRDAKAMPRKLRG